MSPPEPLTVQVPPLRDWSPARAGFPMSAQLQPLGQSGGGVVVLMLTESKVTALTAPALWDVTARPAKVGPLKFSVTLDPATGDQVFPSLEV